jgi:hypothetical protein
MLVSPSHSLKIGLQHKPYSACDLNKVQLKLEAILVMQLTSVDIITNGQTYEVAQQDLANMLVVTHPEAPG